MRERSTTSRLLESARAAEKPSRQEVRRRRRWLREQMMVRLLRVATRGLQAGCALVLFAYVALDFTGFVHDPTRFTVPHIQVRGNTRVTSEDVIATARLAPSVSLWAWPLAEIETRVERHARIARATVLRDFPDRLVIEVEEREPAVLLLGDPLMEVDGEGIVLGPYESGRSPVRPVVTGHGLTDLTPGDRIEDPGVQHALAIAASYERSASHRRIPLAEIALDRPGGPVVWLDPGVQVPCPETPAPIQWARLDAVLNDLRARGTGLHRVAAIDLRFAHIVPVRMRTVAAG